MGRFKLSNEINKEIIQKLRENIEIDDNVKDFIEEALKLEYSVIDEKKPVLKNKYLKFIDDYLE